MKNLIVVDHPLVQHKLTFLRDKNTTSKEFRRLVNEISTLLAYEATRDLPLESVMIETPVTETAGKVVSGLKQVVIPILRTGLGLVDGMLSLLPSAKVGHLGIYRAEGSRDLVDYYTKLPEDLLNRVGKAIEETNFQCGKIMLNGLINMFINIEILFEQFFGIDISRHHEHSPL